MLGDSIAVLRGVLRAACTVYTAGGKGGGGPHAAFVVFSQATVAVPQGILPGMQFQCAVLV